MKRFVTFCLILSLLFGCAATPAESESPQPSSSEVEAEAPESGMPDLLDMDGQNIDLAPEDIFGLQLNYTYGWDPDQEGYIRLQEGTALGDVTVNSAQSQYYIEHQKDSTIKLLCNSSHYWLYPPSDLAVPGLLRINEYGPMFFPYKDAGIKLLLLERRTRDAERFFSFRGTAFFEDGTSAEIQPMYISFGPTDDEMILDQLGITIELPPGWEDEELNVNRPGVWYDVELCFSSIFVGSSSQSLMEDVGPTYASGDLVYEASIIVHGEVAVDEERTFPSV